VLTNLLKRSKFKFGKNAKATEEKLVETAKNLLGQRDEIEKQLIEADKLNDELSCVVKETQDISNELIYKLDHELSLAKRQLDSVSKSLADGLIFLDHLGRILHFNQAAEAMLGVLAGDVLGENVINLFSPLNASLDNKTLPEAAIARCSRRIFSKLKAGESIDGENVGNVTRLGKSSIIETQTPNGPHKFNLTLNILEPNPRKSTDVSYVCIFKPLFA